MADDKGGKPLGRTSAHS